MKLAAILAAVFFAGITSTALAQDTGDEKPPSAAPSRTLADIKDETEANIPYQPCPSNVRFSNGQQMCLGFPEGDRPYHPPRRR
jgi:hypothetical protein